MWMVKVTSAKLKWLVEEKERRSNFFFFYFFKLDSELEKGVWKRGDGSTFDPTKNSLELKMIEEIHFYTFAENMIGHIIEHKGNYLWMQRNGHYISLRKPW